MSPREHTRQLLKRGPEHTAALSRVLRGRVDDQPLGVVLLATWPQRPLEFNLSFREMRRSEELE